MPFRPRSSIRTRDTFTSTPKRARAAAFKSTFLKIMPSVWVLSPSICCSTTLTMLKRVDVGTAANAPSTRNSLAAHSCPVGTFEKQFASVAVGPFTFFIQTLNLYHCVADSSARTACHGKLNSNPQGTTFRFLQTLMLPTQRLTVGLISSRVTEIGRNGYGLETNTSFLQTRRESCSQDPRKKLLFHVGFCWLDRT